MKTTRVQSSHHDFKTAISKTEVLPLSALSWQRAMSVLTLAPELLHWWAYRYEWGNRTRETPQSGFQAEKEEVSLICSVKNPEIRGQIVKQSLQTVSEFV